MVGEPDFDAWAKRIIEYRDDGALVTLITDGFAHPTSRDRKGPSWIVIE
jgi:hypothetical protein